MNGIDDRFDPADQVDRQEAPGKVDRPEASRRTRGRHARSIEVDRTAVVTRLLVCAAATASGAFLLTGSDQPPALVRKPSSGPPILLVLGVVLIVLGWVPVVGLLIRSWDDLRRVAGPLPGRSAVVAACSAPVETILCCLQRSELSRGVWAATLVVGIGVLLWVVAVLWRRPGGRVG
jgi:hypothetical protein